MGELCVFNLIMISFFIVLNQSFEFFYWVLVQHQRACNKIYPLLWILWNLLIFLGGLVCYLTRYRRSFYVFKLYQRIFHLLMIILRGLSFLLWDNHMYRWWNWRYIFSVAIDRWSRNTKLMRKNDTFQYILLHNFSIKRSYFREHVWRRIFYWPCPPFFSKKNCIVQKYN